MKKYQIIYADPPWSYSVMRQIPGGRTNPYRGMRYIDILDLPIKDLADKNCVLFLWATMPLLPEALYTMKHWGFEYKTTAFVWVKKNKKSDGWFWGMGSWTRSNPEICLLGVKGEPKTISNRVHSVIDTPLEEHSKKPAEVRKRIVELCGDIPRIELFARKGNVLFEDESFKGWDVWGNQVESDINL